MKGISAFLACSAFAAVLTAQQITPPKTHLKVGDEAPDFTLKEAESNRDVKLSDFRGKNRTTTGDLPQPQAHFKSQSQNFFGLAHGQSPGWQATLPFLGRLPAIVLSSAVGPVGINPARSNALPGSA
jgi:hypothetical protein